MKRLHLLLLGFIILAPFISVGSEPEGEPLKPEEMEDDEVVYNRTYSEHQSLLQQTIFKGYDRSNRPVKNPDDTVEVDLHLHVTHIAFNQKEQTMTVHGHMYMCWLDEFLAWNPKDYAGVTTTNLKKWQIWMPDIRVSNSINGIYSSHDISRNAHITLQAYATDGVKYDKAKVETYPTFAMKVGCFMDFSDYPYDSHACGVRIYTPTKMRQVKLNVYRQMPPTMFLSWSNESQKTTSGDFNIHRASNNISYYRFGDTDMSAPITGNGVSKTWSIYNMYIYYTRVSGTYFATVAIPLASSTLLSLFSLLIKDVQYATLLNGITFILHTLFIKEFSVICPVSVNTIPRAMMFHGWSVGLTIFVFCFQLFLWSVTSVTAIQRFLIEGYSRVYRLLPFNPAPGFMQDFVQELGDIRERGWKQNSTVWRVELFFILTLIYLILFARAFLI